MKKKVMTALLCATMVIGMMAGCGSKGGSGKNTNAKYKIGICQLVVKGLLQTQKDGSASGAGCSNRRF